MRTLSVWLITLYQRYLSKHKGFGCAYLAVHGGVSCSQAVKLIIQQEGLWRGRALIKARFAACRAAAISRHGKHENNNTTCDSADCFTNVGCEAVDCMDCSHCG